MSFSELYDQGFKERNQNHFAAIIRVAMADGVITEEEVSFLDRLADRLEISEAEYEDLLKNHASHPIDPPVSYDIRLERLYDLVSMVYADQIKDDAEISLLNKIAVALGFRAINVKYIVDKAYNLVATGSDLENFIYQIKNMNQ